MPDTPSTWLNDFTVNLTITDAQANPCVTHLANGNILVVWDSANNSGVGAYPGLDVIGQLFSPLGTPVGAERRLNYAQLDFDDRSADVSALPDGGFRVAYQTAANGLFFVTLETFDATAVHVSSAVIASDDAAFSVPSNFPPKRQGKFCKAGPLASQAHPNIPCRFFIFRPT